MRLGDFWCTSGCTRSGRGVPQCTPGTHRAVVRPTPPRTHPQDTQGHGRQAPMHPDIPGVQPHCCGGSLQSGHLAGSPAHLQTPETPSLQIRCPHCSRPTSSPRLASPGGGCCSHRWRWSPRSRSVSRQRPHQRRRWHARRLTPAWLRGEANGLAGPSGVLGRLGLVTLSPLPCW